jgi:ABC-type Fe3+/spermidine/putrescine transport system ATPase subunit
MSRPTSIRLERVTKVYDGPVVEDVSLDVAEASFVTLLGPSGSGKSTILQMIGGFVQPTSGRILFGGEDVTSTPPNRRPCNTIFQDLGLFPHMSVAENVAYGLRLRRIPTVLREKRVADMLALVALESLARRRVHQLSGGQRQRVALARALVLDPPLLLLDEPLTGLDERLRQQLRDEVGRLHRRLGSTFLAVTHNQDEALALSDRIAVMRAGRVEQVAAPQELYENPVSAFVAGFVGFDVSLTPERVEPGEREWTAFVAGSPIACPPPQRRAAEGYRLAWRPERVRLAQPGEAADLTSVTVAAAAFKGRDMEIEARLADGRSMRFLIPADGRAPPPGGAEVALVFSPSRPQLVVDG